jgi:hypothetical protein
MKYRGFIIEKVVAAGADFDFTADGRLKPRKPHKEDTTYDVLDPMEGDSRYCTEDSLTEAKAAIRAVLAKMGMKDNSPQSWALLEGNPYAN